MKLRTFPVDKRNRVTRSQKERKRFLDRNHKKCWYCGTKVKKKGFILEHQQPFSKGGSCGLNDNIVLSCNICDKIKGVKTVEEFRNTFKKGHKFHGEK